MEVPVPLPAERIPVLFFTKRFFVSVPEAPAASFADVGRFSLEFLSCLLISTVYNLLLKGLFVLS